MSFTNLSQDTILPTEDQSVALADSKAIERSFSTRCKNVRHNGSSGKLPFSRDEVRLDEAAFNKLYPNLPLEIVNKVFQSSDALIELYHIFGFTRPENLSHHIWIKYQGILTNFRKRMCDYIVQSGDNNSWVAYLKFKTCAFYAFYEKQDRPDPPKGLEDEVDSVIFGGLAHRWVKLLRISNRRLFDSFTVSVNLAKKGLPRPTEDMRLDACKKTVRALTTEPFVPEVADFLMDPIVFPHAVTRDNPFGSLTKEVVKFELRRTVKELFADRAYTNAVHYEPFFPSTSANYIRSRGKAGAVSVIRELISKIQQVRNVQKKDVNLVDINLIDVKTRGKLSEHYGQQGISEDLRSYQEIMMGKEFNELGLSFDDTELREQWVELFDLIEKLAKDEEPLVEAVALLEALKVRVISKGPALLYTLLKPMQKFMWQTLKENDVFKMISEPISESHINKMFPNMFDDELMVNGDYKASTDNLHGYCSEEVVNTIIDVLNESKHLDKHHLSETYRELFIRSLTKHTFINPEYDMVEAMFDQERDEAPNFCEEVSRVERRELQKYLPQKEGQLMGSVTSFPILCIVNATLCRMALEQTNGIRYRLGNKPVEVQGVVLPMAPLYVNGDDCTLKGRRSRNKGLRHNWQKITAFGGLASSVGKTFFSNPDRPICVLNSMTYLYEEGKWREVKAVNLGILFGLQRSSTEISCKHEYHELGGLHRDLKKQCPEEIWSQVSSRFIHFQIDTLREYPNIPWSAPEYLGGPGLVPDKEMSEHDRRACSFLIAHMNDPKSKAQVSRCKVKPEWKVYEIAEEQIRARLEVPDHYYEVRPKVLVDQSSDYKSRNLSEAFQLVHENYEQLTSSLTIQQLFTSEHLSDMFSPDTHNKSKVRSLQKINRTIMKRNMAAWKKANNEAHTVSFIRTEAEINQEQKKLFTPCVRGRPEWYI